MSHYYSSEHFYRFPRRERNSVEEAQFPEAGKDYFFIEDQKAIDRLLLLTSAGRES